MDSTKHQAAIPGGSDEKGRKSTAEHWNAIWSRDPSKGLPSSLNVTVWDLKRLLKRHLRPDSSYLEIGCAPGKMLAWVAATLRAQVSGLDYSVTGADAAKRFFGLLRL